MGYISMGQIEQELYGDLENDVELEVELLVLQGEEGGGGSQFRFVFRRKYSEYMNIVKDLYNCFRDDSGNFLLLQQIKRNIFNIFLIIIFDQCEN